MNNINVKYYVRGYLFCRFDLSIIFLQGINKARLYEPLEEEICLLHMQTTKAHIRQYQRGLVSVFLVYLFILVCLK